MVHSQGVIVGYGVIVPIEAFVAIFPGSFVYDDGWVPNRITDMNTNLIKFVYQEETTSTSVFITTAAATEYSFEKGYIIQEYSHIDMERMINEAHQVRQWLKDIFPNYNQGFYIYGLEYV